MVILVLISLFIFSLYLTGIVARYGLPASVSETFYLLPGRWRWAFTLFCWGVSFCLLPAWFEITRPGCQPLVFLSGAGLAFVGAAPMFKEDFVARVHYIAAGVCILASQLWIVLAAGLWWVSLLCFAVAVWLGLRNRKAWLFWVEVAAFASTYIAVFARM